MESRQKKRLLERKPWIAEHISYKFVGPMFTYQIPRFELDENGETIYGENIRTKFKKAYKSFLNGKMIYRYKNQYRVVPKAPYNTLNNNEEE